MQSVNAAFTAIEKSAFRQIGQSVQISWHKQSIVGNRTFTIGVSVIGGNDLIGINPGAVGSPSNYKYFDESVYVLNLAWERGYNMPQGGLTMAMAEAHLNNTSKRFTPRYMGGNSELSTAILPSRPAMISAGFNLGADQLLPQFMGLISEQPQVGIRDRIIDIKMMDYVYYFQNKFLDSAVIFTGQRTDQVLQTLMTQLGMSTAQYKLDMGINVIPYGAFDVGIKFSDAIGKLVEAENGHFYQDEYGIFRFENRQHWSSAPYNSVQKVITTAMVLDAQSPDQSHLVNVVEINGQAYVKQPEQIIYRLSPFDVVTLNPNAKTDIFVNFDDPVLSMTTPSNGGTQSYFQAFQNSDGSGVELTGNIVVDSVYRFAQSAKITLKNNGGLAYLTNLVITGRVAHSVAPIYTKATANASITAYQEQSISIDNPFIQNQSWAETYAQMILTDFSRPENLQKITIRAIPELQLGDLISWQGRYWRIFDIKTTLDPSQGFSQELTLLQRTITTYFRIGISTIGGTDQISP